MTVFSPEFIAEGSRGTMEDLVKECECRAAANTGEERRFFWRLFHRINHLEAELLRQNGECINAVAENERLLAVNKEYKDQAIRYAHELEELKGG